MLVVFDDVMVALLLLLVAKPNYENKSIVGSFCYENMFWLLLMLLLLLNWGLLKFEAVFWEGNPNELKVLLFPLGFILLNMLLLFILLKFEEFWIGSVISISNGFNDVFDAVFVGFWLKMEFVLLLMLVLKELLDIPKLLLLDGKKDADPPVVFVVVALFYWIYGEKPIKELENISKPPPLLPIGLKVDCDWFDDYGIGAVKKLNGSSDLFS